MRMFRAHSVLGLAALSFIPVQGITLDVTSDNSIKSAASTLASSVLGFYHGNETGNTIGLLPSPPYYWWESGAMFDTLIKYWRVTGDSQYNDLVTQGLVAQQGSDGNFMPLNQTRYLGNDDQSQWAFAAMSAAEANFPQPANTSWISLAEEVFTSQTARWDKQTCDGGLRWQIFSFNTGYDYKNAITNGHFFQLAARLASSSPKGSSSGEDYADWATRAFDWTKTIGLIGNNYAVYDGAHTSENCTDINKVEFTHAAGTFIIGAAHMYNITTGDTQATWKTSLDGLLNYTLTAFFPSGIATERACETRSSCSTDMFVFKGLLLHWLADTTQIAPHTAQSINKVLASSAQAAARNCDSTGCPSIWGGGVTGQDNGVGQQLSALNAVQALLVHKQAADASGRPATTTSTSTGSAAAALSSTSDGRIATSSNPMGVVLLWGSLGATLAFLW